MAADVVAEEAAAVRRAADVHALGLGREERLQPASREAVAPVHLLAEEEEALVERADLVDRRAAHEQAGAHHELDLALAAWSNPPP